ncbi:MAG: proteasome assembly chaperone family protein [Candidatus Undinarchaeales archaeon]|nr:proteasome assembly chaperone family protein [Candidatus Undinarchaeales archaeon]
MDTFIKYSGKKPKLNNPVLIEGLPGFGQVGRLVAEHLVKEFNGKQFAELYSPHFPPQVMIQNDGRIDTITNNFFYIPKMGGKRDVLLVIGEAQGATITGQYEICEKILDVAKEFGVKDLVTIGGYATGRLLKEPKVFGAANNNAYIKEFGKHGVVFKTKGNRGGIVGASGLLVGLSQLRDINSLCLMGETPGHPLLIDAKAAEKVLEVLGKWLGINIKMGALDKRAKELEKFRLNLEKMMKKMKKEKGEPGTGEEAGTDEDLKYIG